MTTHESTGRYFRPVSVWLALFLLVVLGGCSEEPRWNVVIVTFDTTRADHLSPYGHPQARTPVSEQLAREGVVFERAAAPVPITLPSHSTLMTGKAPFTHGVRDNGLFSLGEEQLTLAEILSQAGYRTAAAIASFPLTSQFGINQGFDTFDEAITGKYEDLYGQRSLAKTALFFDERPAAQVNEAIFPWLDRNHHAPFFLWVHYFDPHHPHEPPAPYDQLFAHDLYSGEIAYADENLGNLIERLKTLGVYDRTLLVLTSDHGEGNGEHNESTHSTLMYNSTMHVPLIIRHPQQMGAGTRVTPWVGIADVMPTVLDILDIEPPSDIQGSSLWPFVETPELIAETSASEIYAETLSPRLSYGWGELRGLYYRQIKYIHGPRPELYDLSTDHDEKVNLIDRDPELAASMKARLEAYLNEHRVAGLDSSISASEETLNRLRGLGYVQFSTDAVGVIEETLRDDGKAPQDFARLTSHYSTAKNLLYQGRAVEASRYINLLLEADPDNRTYLEMLLKSELSRGRFDEALDLLSRLPADGTGTFSGARLIRTIGQVQEATGDLDAAIQTYIDAEAIEPTAQGQYHLAQLSNRRGQNDAYLSHLRRATELDPDFLAAQVDLAIAMATTADTQSARQMFEQALTKNPYDARTLYNYGTLLVQAGEFELAVEPFKRALAINPRYVKAHSALIETLHVLGRFGEMAIELDELIHYAPNHPETLRAKGLSETS